MAKKKTVTEDIIIEDHTTIQVEQEPVVDTLRDSILHYKCLGWDDNRIAARLMIQKSIVEQTHE